MLNFATFKECLGLFLGSECKSFVCIQKKFFLKHFAGSFEQQVKKRASFVLLLKGRN